MESQLRIGDLTVTSVSDGHFLSVAAFFAQGIDTADAEALMRDAGRDPSAVHVPANGLLIRGGGHTVVIDPGAGSATRDPRIPATQGRFVDGLRAAGVAAGEVDTVVLTHGHYDHIGGLLDAHGGLAFPNAVVAMDEAEFMHWNTSGGFGAGAIPREIADLIAETAKTATETVRDRVAPLRPGTPIAPGIIPIAAPGHTVGHTAIVIDGGSEQLLVLGDAPGEDLVALTWPQSYLMIDDDPHAAISTRRRLLDQAARDGMLVHAFHFPAPGFGGVERHGAGWQLSPAR